VIEYERQPRELNKNRKGPIQELHAIVDLDLEGNANIIKICLCPHGCERPLVSVEESGFEPLKELFFNMQKVTSRRLQLVKFTNVEVILG
jgi:hypothetical protein